MTDELVREQSKAAYGQWAEQWREQAKVHAAFPMKPLTDFENIGVGRAVLCVANGYSFEENIETIKKHQSNVDIICCDKTLGHLIDNGITPTYCLVCDANVNYESYMEKWKDKLQGTIALVNVCANPKWTANGNWKSIYFFVNKDILDTQVEFSAISGCKNFIPAGTNVSNAMVVMLTQSDNNGRKNFFGYDKILLIGYDYSWRFGGKYYAFNETGEGKSSYMKHQYIQTMAGTFGYTSGNLSFSAQWLHTYINAFNLSVVQCTKETILATGRMSELATGMQYRHKPEDAGIVRSLVERLRLIESERSKVKNTLVKIGRDHYQAHLASI